MPCMMQLLACETRNYDSDIRDAMALKAMDGATMLNASSIPPFAIIVGAATKKHRTLLRIRLLPRTSGADRLKPVGGVVRYRQ